MPSIGSSPSPHPALPAFGPSPAPQDPLAHRPARPPQQPPREPALIERELKQKEEDLARLFAEARLGGLPAPLPAHMPTATLHHIDMRNGRTSLSVAYRVQDGSRRSRSCKLDPFHESVPNILQLDEERCRLKSELAAARKAFRARARQEPVPDRADSRPAAGASSPRARGTQQLIAAAQPDWLSLPQEIQLKILCHLDPRSLRGIRLAHREWERLAMLFMPAWHFTSASAFREVMAVFAQRGDLDKIRSLTLEGDSFTYDDLALLPTLPRLGTLKLFCPAATDQCGRHIARCEALESLDVSGNMFGNQFVKALLPESGADNTVLKELVLRGSFPLSVASAADIVRFRALKILDVAHGNLHAAFLKGLLSPGDGGVPVNDTLQELDISFSPLLGVEAGSLLSQFRALKVLRLDNCNLTDEFLDRLLPADEDGVRYNDTLEILSLNRNGRLTAASGAILRGFRALKELSVEWCALQTPFLHALLSDEDGVVRHNDVLTKLSLMGNEDLTDAIGDLLSHCLALKALDVSYCDLSNDFLERLLRLPESSVLEELNLAFNPAMTNDCAALLTRCSALKSLNVHGCGFEDEFFDAFLTDVDDNQEKVNTRLEFLVVADSEGLSDESGHIFSRFTALAHLDARYCGLGDDFVKNLLRDEHADNTVLKCLDLGGNPLSDEAGRHIRRFRQLEILRVEECDRIGAGFVGNLLPEPGAKNRTLKALHLSSCKELGDDCADPLAQFEALNKLWIFNCTSLSDEFARRMPPSIRHLCCAYTGFTESMREALAMTMKIVAYHDPLA